MNTNIDDVLKAKTPTPGVAPVEDTVIADNTTTNGEQLPTPVEDTVIDNNTTTNGEQLPTVTPVIEKPNEVKLLQKIIFGNSLQVEVAQEEAIANTDTTGMNSIQADYAKASAAKNAEVSIGPEISRTSIMGMQAIDINNRLNEVIAKGRAPEVKFRYADALRSGYTSKEILDHLQDKTVGYDIKAARTAGIPDSRIIMYLSNRKIKQKQNVIQASMPTSDFDLGVYHASAGILNTIGDIEGLLGKEHDKEIKQVQEYTKTIDQMVKDKDFFSMYTLGRAMPSLLTLPLATQTKLGVFALESVLGYSDARGTEDKATSTAIGAISGTAGVALQVAGKAVVNKITGRKAQEENIKAVISSLSPKAAKATREYFQDLLHLSEGEVEDITKQWKQISESTGNIELDRLLAITHSGSDEMVGLLGTMRRQDVDMFKVLRQRRVDTVNLMKNLISTSDNELNDIIVAIPKQYKVVEDNYDAIINMLSDKYMVIQKIQDGESITNIKLSREARKDSNPADFLVSSKSVLRELLGKETRTVEDTINAYRHTNNLISSSKGLDKANYKKIAMKLDEELKSTLSEQDYKYWRLANDDYAMISRIRQSTIGKAFNKLHTGKVTTDEFINLLKLNKDGDEVFTDINNLIGSNKASALEKLIVKQFFNTNPDSVSFEVIANSLNKKGFVTTQGKTLQDYVNKIATAFKTEDRLYQSLSRFNTPETGGLSSSITDRFKVFFASRVFKSLLKFLPTSEGKFLRMESKLKKALLNQPDFKELDEVIGKLSEETKAKVFTDIEKQFDAWLEYTSANSGVRISTIKNEVKNDMKPIEVEATNTTPKNKVQSVDKLTFNNLALNESITQYIDELSPETIKALKSPVGTQLLTRLLQGKISEEAFAKSLGLNVKALSNTRARKGLEGGNKNEAISLIQMVSAYKAKALDALKDTVESTNVKLYHNTRGKFDPNEYNFNKAKNNNLRVKPKTGYDLGPGLYGHLSTKHAAKNQHLIEYSGNGLKMLPVLNEREYLEIVKFFTGKNKVGPKEKQALNEYLESIGYDGVITRQSGGHTNMGILFKRAMSKVTGKYVDKEN